MATIAPWIIPPNFLGAMEAGTAAGLRFAYDSLAAKEQQASQLAAQKHELARAAMELRGQQMQGLQDYREKQLEAKQNELGLRQQLGEANLGIAQQRADSAAERLRLTQDKTPGELITKEVNGETYQWGVNGWKHVPKFRPATDTITETIPAVEAVPGTPAIPAKPPMTILGLPIPFTGKPAVPAVPAVPETREKRITRRVPVDLSSAAAALQPTSTGTLPAPAGAEVIRTTKDGRKAVFDAQTKKFIRYADEKPTTAFSDTAHDEEE
jgi:hypothetical protein